MSCKFRKPTGVTACGTSAASLECPLRLIADGMNGARLACAEMPEPERLVGFGFRYWMLGRRTGDIGCWESAWSLYSGMFGPARARMAVGALSDWVAALGRGAGREIEVGEARCVEFCRDECLAISTIAACQHRTCPAMRACTFALIERGQIAASRVDEVTTQAQTFADTMASLEQVLSRTSIITDPAALRTRNALPI